MAIDYEATPDGTAQADDFNEEECTCEIANLIKGFYW
jgi:hypothetical protein